MKNGTTPRSSRGRSDDGKAFLPDPYETNAKDHHTASRDTLADVLAAEFLTSATSAEDVTQDNRDALSLEEVGGPFIETSAQEEFAGTIDEMNPADAERAAFPTTTSES